MKRVTTSIITILLLSGIVLAAGVAELGVSPDTPKNISVGSIGHYTLTLTTSTDPKGGNLHWASDDPLIWANIGATPTGQFGDSGITSSSSCSGTPQVCTQTFDLQVQPQSGITVQTVHEITVTYETKTGVAKAMVTAGTIPTPELSTGILLSVGLIGLIGLVRLKRK